MNIESKKQQQYYSGNTKDLLELVIGSQLSVLQENNPWQPATVVDKCTVMEDCLDITLTRTIQTIETSHFQPISSRNWTKWSKNTHIQTLTPQKTLILHILQLSIPNSYSCRYRVTNSQTKHQQTVLCEQTQSPIKFKDFVKYK